MVGIIMGIGNFIKRHTGVDRLPDSELNEVTVVKVLKAGAPFVIYLPMWDTVKSGGGTSISKSMGGGYRQTVYNRPSSRKVQRKVKTLITYNLEQTTIQHAQKNGKHIIIKNNKIVGVGKGSDGISIELENGLQYQFIMDKEIKNKWKQLGFNPQFPIDVFYNLLSGAYVRELQQKYQTTNMDELMARANEAVNEDFNITNSLEEPEFQKNNYPYKTKSKNNEKKSESPVEKIKEAKELFDMGIITEDEFKKIKNKYIELF